MHTQNVNVAASESSKTWVKGQKICVSAKDLRTRWHVTGENGEKVTPTAGKHYPARNGSYGADVLLLDETDVIALMDAGHTSLLCLASSGRGMTAMYDLGENATGRYIIASRGQIFYRSASWQETCREYIRRASSVAVIIGGLYLANRGAAGKSGGHESKPDRATAEPDLTGGGVVNAFDGSGQGSLLVSAQSREKEAREQLASMQKDFKSLKDQMPAINIRKLPATTVSATRNTVLTYVRKNNQNNK